jgi:thiamine biosynthesis lipoprotein
MKKNLIYLFTISFIVFISCNNIIKEPIKSQYFANFGEIHGTYYNIQYEYANDIQTDLLKVLDAVNQSLSTYIDTSIISRINNGEQNVELDTLFTIVFNEGKEVFKKTNGAFDMTVAPIVNAWGFGYTDSIHVDSLIIDSIMQYVGFDKIKLENNKIVKQFPGIKLDGSAIAKGYSVDFVCYYLESLGIKNFLVDIGGEVRASGKNKSGVVWRVGIDKPIFDENVSDRKLQEIVSLKNISIATSGNYRQFYKRNGKMYSHTINPKTGYPAINEVLSVSVLNKKCMVADAYATAFMVLGLEKSKNIVENDTNLSAYIIYKDSLDSHKVWFDKGFEQIIAKN